MVTVDGASENQRELLSTAPVAGGRLAQRNQELVPGGETPGRVCPRLGPLRSAALRRTATGFRSPASAVSPEPLGLQRYGPAPSEGIQDRRRAVGEAPVDLGPGLGQHVGVVGVLPLHEPLQNPEEPLPLRILLSRRQRRVA